MAAPALRKPGSGPNQDAALHFLIALGRGPNMSPNRPAPQRAAPSPVPRPGQPMRRFAKGTMPKKKTRESVNLNTYAKGTMSAAEDARLDKKAGIKEGSARDNRLDKERGVPTRYAKGSGGRLTAAARRALPSSTFAGPNRSFPIPDKNHARAALGLINHAPASARPKIRARAEAMLRK